MSNGTSHCLYLHLRFSSKTGTAPLISHKQACVYRNRFDCLLTNQSVLNVLTVGDTEKPSVNCSDKVDDNLLIFILNPDQANHS